MRADSVGFAGGIHSNGTSAGAFIILSRYDGETGRQTVSGTQPNQLDKLNCIRIGKSNLDLHMISSRPSAILGHSSVFSRSSIR